MTPESVCTFTDTLSALLTPTIAFCAIGIGIQQYKLAKERFKLDLFDKRYLVFDATRNFLHVICRDSKLESLEDLGTFQAGTADASFLFDSKIADYIKKVKTVALEIRQLQATYKDLPKGEEKSEQLNREFENLKWCGDQLKTLEEIFSQYMKFKI